jgi:CBS domain-containing protein
VHFLRADESVLECTPDVVENVKRALDSEGVLGGDVRVGEVMGGHAVLISAQTPYCAALEALARAKPGPLLVGVVVDADGTVLGTLEHAEPGLVDEVEPTLEAARAVAPVHESSALGVAIERMVKERRRALPVVSSDGKVVGLISDLDALHWVAGRKHPPERL